MASAAVKGREILKQKEKFPQFNIMDYDKSLRDNLCYYNLEIDNKNKKDWAIKYWQSNKKDTKSISKLADGYFSTCGAVAHMIKFRDISLETQHEAYLSKKYKELVERSVECEEPEKKVSTIDKFELELTNHISEFECGVDLFFKGESFDFKTYLVRNGVKAPMTKKIADHFKPMLKELKEAASNKNEQLVEAYSMLSTRNMTKFISYIQSLITSCEVASAIVSTKSARKTRAKPPTEVVKHVKWLLEDKTSKTKSEHPTKILTSSEVWIYNAKNRRLFKYVSLEGTHLSIKGTTIINIDLSKSGGKIIRKPETQLKDVQTLAKRDMSKFYSGVRGTESKGVGRLNSDSLIIKCFN